MTKDNQWIEWSGGENPVPGKVAETRHRGGEEYTGSEAWPSDRWFGGRGFWIHNGTFSDIIAYRVIEPAKDNQAAALGLGLKMFPAETTGVQSRIVIAHQLRASADIQDAETKRETGWADTSDRASLMREAALSIERMSRALVVARGHVQHNLSDAEFNDDDDIVRGIKSDMALIDAALSAQGEEG